MPSIFNVIFEFVPIAILSGILIFIVLYIKYINRMSLRSVGSDICLGALFIQITLLAVPVWMSGHLETNVKGQVVMVFLTLVTWIITASLLKQIKPSRKRSRTVYRKIADYFIKRSDLREKFSFVIGTFALSISLMMMLDTIRFSPSDWGVQTTHLILATFASTAIGYGVYSVYLYLQNEQFTHSFERFSREITRDNLLLTIQSSGAQIHDRDPIQPVVDIVRGSIMKGVLGPALFGMEILKRSSLEFLTSSGMRRSSIEKVTLHFISQIDEIGKLALRMDEDEAAMASIHKMGEIGECSLSKGNDVPAEDVLRRLSEYYEVLRSKDYEIMKLAVTDAIRKVGSAAAVHGVESAASKASNMLGAIGTPAVREKEIDTINETVNALSIIGKESAANSLEGSVKQSAMKLRDMGTSAVQIDLVEEPLKIIDNLQKMGVASAANKLELGAEQVIWAIKDIGVAYGYQRVDKGINGTAVALSAIGIESSQRKLDDVVDQVMWSLKEISMHPISENIESSIGTLAHTFAKMAEVENRKVEKTLQEIKKYFGTEETERYKRFEKEYNSARKAMETHK